MSEPGKYDGERCEGCVSWDPDLAQCNFGPKPEIAFSNQPACDQFEPDLQCRQVRALERLASLMGAPGPHGGLAVDVWKIGDL
jgi:hypothetical protein